MKIFYMTHSYGQKYILKSCLAVAYLRTEAVFDKKKKVNIFPVMVVIIYTPCCKLFIGKKKLRRNYIPKSKRKNLTVIHTIHTHKYILFNLFFFENDTECNMLHMDIFYLYSRKYVCIEKLMNQGKFYILYKTSRHPEYVNIRFLT